jgi:hypothetical protein
MLHNKWHVSSCVVRLLIVASAGIRLNKRALVGRQKEGKEQRGSDL